MPNKNAVRELLEAIETRQHVLVGRTTGEIARRFDIDFPIAEELLTKSPVMYRSEARLWSFLPGVDYGKIKDARPVVMAEKNFYTGRAAVKVEQEVKQELKRRAKAVPAKPSPEPAPAPNKSFDLTKFLR